MPSVKVIRPGSDVTLVSGQTVQVTQVSLAGQELCVQYQIVWWNDGARKSEWIYANEIDQHINDPVVDVQVERRE